MSADVFRLVSTIGFAALAFGTLYAMARNRSRLWYFVPAFLYAVHGFAYYLLWFVCRSGEACGFSFTFSEWSSLLRLHGLMATGALVMAIALMPALIIKKG